MPTDVHRGKSSRIQDRRTGPAGVFTGTGLMLYLLTLPVAAGDWPQILGPERTGIGRQEKLADRWPDSGPKTRWTHRTGEGTAGVAVLGETVVLFHRQGDEEVIEALAASTGSRAGDAPTRPISARRSAAIMDRSASPPLLEIWSSRSAHRVCSVAGTSKMESRGGDETRTRTLTLEKDTSEQAAVRWLKTGE